MLFGLAHAKDLAIGGLGSPGGSIAWYVVGIEVSIRDWALHQG
jgi:hypothetical protein